MNKSGEGSEEDIHYISDQDSTDDKPQIESIIKEKTNVFKNESYIIKILLSEHHRDLRSKFFSGVRFVHNSIYQAIKREIRNCLNPYRIFVSKDKEMQKEFKELFELLKRYYKEKNFNDTFFINYFKYLKAANNDKKKAKFINMLPKDEIETLNDLQRKVTIVRSLRHYLNTSIRDRFQINFEQKKEMYSEDEFNIMYKYMVIKKEKLSLMKEEELDEYMSNKKGSYKLRRPLNDFNVYNYLPILCKGYCQKEAKLFAEFFERAFMNHAPRCKKCKELYNHLDEIKSQIYSLYKKTCIFSHNINEIMFHPLFFNSFSNNPFYLNQFNNKDNINVKSIEDIVEAAQPPKKYKTFKNIYLRMIYNPGDNGMKIIFNKLREYSSKVGLFGNNCFLPKYKTTPCPIDLFKPNEKDFEIHMIKCPFYHNNLEKRRNIIIKENEICKEVIKDGEWKIDENNIKCKNSDLCCKFHTRNELFYDKKNYRKLYPCDEKKYCQKGDLCPKKHPTDMKIDELYLSEDSRKDLERMLKKLIEKEKKLKTRVQKLSKIQCISCMNLINGEKGLNLNKFINCNHVICSKCYDFYKICPLCGRIDIYNDENEEKDDKIYINLNYNNKNIILYSNDDKDELNESDEEDEKSDEEIKELEDDDEDNEGEKDEFIFNNCNDVAYESDDDEEKSSNNSNIKENEIKNNNENNKKKGNNSFNENSFNDSSYSTNSNNTRIRGRETRGRDRRGDYGRLGRGKYKRGNPKNNYNSYSFTRGGNSYNSGKSDSSYDDDNDCNKSSDDEENKEKDVCGNSLNNNNESRGKGRIRGKNRGRGILRARGRNIRRNNIIEDDNNDSDEE